MNTSFHTKPCPHCRSRLVRVVTGNIVHWTHNPADGNGHLCPPETGEH